MPWRDLLRGVLFRVTAEAWVETESVGRYQWGWRLRDRAGRVIKSLNGRHIDRGTAFDAAVRFFRRHSEKGAKGSPAWSDPVDSGANKLPGVESTSVTDTRKSGRDRTSAG